MPIMPTCIALLCLPLASAFAISPKFTISSTHYTPSPILRRRAPPVTLLAVPPILGPLAGIGVLTTVVVVHEAGHFLAARSQGIRVAEFSIGFGPRLFEIPPKTPESPGYALRALPLGGFVSFPRATNRTRLEEMGLLEKGEVLKEEIADAPDLLENANWRQQAVVICAGVAANIMLAWALLFTSGVSLGVPVFEPQPVVVRRVLPSSPAEAAGFRAGDTLLRVRGVQIEAVDTNSGGNPAGESLDGSKRRPASTYFLLCFLP